MTEIGVVNYQIEPTGNVIDAVWYYSGLTSNEIGSGKAKGDTSGGFPGEYIVDYFLADGSPAGTFELAIKRAGGIYELSWSQNGGLLYVGVGIETACGLTASYTKAT